MKHIIPSQKNTGFTLIEALVAVFIFSSAVVFLITIAGRGLLAMNSAQNQTTAYFLAQEGIEIVHNLRNEAFLNTESWLNRIPQQCINAECGFHIIGSNNQMVGDVCSSLNGCKIEKDASTPSKFAHSGGDPTPFTRNIQITEDSALGMAHVQSTVSWQQGLFTRRVVLDEILREWVVSGGQQLQSVTPLAPTPTQQGSLQIQTP